MDRVYIQWVDSSTPAAHGWIPIDEVADFPSLTIETVGFLFKETDDYCTVVSSIHPDEVQGVMTIPKIAMKEMIRYDENMNRKEETHGKN